MNYSVISIFKLWLGAIAFPPSIKWVQVFSILKQTDSQNKNHIHNFNSNTDYPKMTAKMPVMFTAVFPGSRKEPGT